MFQTSSLSDWLSYSGWVALSSRFQSMPGRQAAYSYCVTCEPEYSFPLRGKVGMGVGYSRTLTHPHPNPPLEGEGILFVTQSNYKNPDLNEFGHKSALPRRKTTTSDALTTFRSSCFSV